MSRQDVALWSRPMIDEAESTLSRASEAKRPGRFPLEAAIQSVHARRAVTGHTEWDAIALLYEGLIRLAPTIGAQVGQAAALAETRGAESGLSALGAIPPDVIAGYQPYWALSRHLLRQLGRMAEARGAYARAVELSQDPAVRDFLSDSF